MGILRLKVEANDNPTTTTTTSLRTTLGDEVPSKRNTTTDSTTSRTAAAAAATTTTTWGRCRITWVTISGWLLSTVLESPSNNGSSIKKAMVTTSFYQVLHAPPKVQYRNADGDLIPPTTTTTMRKQQHSSWSLPADPIAVDKTHNSNHHLLCCWSDVPAVTNILPHHNKYVLDSQPRVVRSPKRALLYRTITNGTVSATQTMALPGSKAPQAIAVHPGGGPHLEWIVMGVDHRLVLMTAGRRS
jgi:hypothetical protein